MALIKCPECKKKISDRCDICPNCGYPVKACFTNNDSATLKTVVSHEVGDGVEDSLPNHKRSVIKKAWFWIVVVLIIVTITISVIIHFSKSEIEAKVDDNGNPIFVELTDEVYTNADEYLGYYVNIVGKVFQNIGDDGEFKGVLVWIDPDNCEQNLMIYYTTDDSLENGDYVICTGYIKEIHTYVNAYGTELSVPLVYSVDLRRSTYIEAMSPTISTIKKRELRFEKYGYSITIDKIEFAENETRLYLTATNNGEATLHIDTISSVILRNGKQFNSELNYGANYTEMPDTLHKGAKASGVITFAAIEDEKFEYVIEVYSDDYDEEFMPVVFRIEEEGENVKEYETAIKNALSVMNGSSDDTHCLFPEKLWKWLDNNVKESTDELEKKVCEQLLLTDQSKDRDIPYIIHVESSLSSNEMKDLLEDTYKSKYKGIDIDFIEDAYLVETEIILKPTYSQCLSIVLVKIDGQWYWANLLHFS